MLRPPIIPLFLISLFQKLNMLLVCHGTHPDFEYIKKVEQHYQMLVLTQTRGYLPLISVGLMTGIGRKIQITEQVLSVRSHVIDVDR